MLRVQDSPCRLCDGITRRDWLQVGALTTLGLSLPQFLAAPSAGWANASDRAFGKAKGCILIFLVGGPPQHETWDPKPEAPAEIRGELRAISTTVPGLQVGELMPQLAQRAHLWAVLRAMSTNDNAHSASGYWMLTGYPHQPMNQESAKPGPPNNWPCVGAVVRKLLGDRKGLPAAVTLPERIVNNPNIPWPGQDAGFLGRSADPWLLVCDPSAPNFQIPELTLPAELPPLRLQQRVGLLEQVNRHLDQVERTGMLAQYDHVTQKAFDLLRGAAGRRAFDLSQEPPELRARYGQHKFGQSLLLARRLIEAGVRLVQVNWPREPNDTSSNAPVWDTHAKNAERLKTALMPPMDQACSALLDDLQSRGLLDETLVVWMGEFGRTPKINRQAGRDHWGHVFSVALAGAGVRGGVVYGASDKTGAYPKEGRVEPQDLTATIFHCLGLDPHGEFRDAQGRTFAISRGKVIRSILV
jgi:hypothetical protein